MADEISSECWPCNRILNSATLLALALRLRTYSRSWSFSTVTMSPLLSLKTTRNILSDNFFFETFELRISSISFGSEGVRTPPLSTRNDDVNRTTVKPVSVSIEKMTIPSVENHRIDAFRETANKRHYHSLLTRTLGTRMSKLSQILWIHSSRSFVTMSKDRGLPITTVARKNVFPPSLEVFNFVFWCETFNRRVGRALYLITVTSVSCVPIYMNRTSVLLISSVVYYPRGDIPLCNKNVNIARTRCSYKFDNERYLHVQDAFIRLEVRILISAGVDS